MRIALSTKSAIRFVLRRNFVEALESPHSEPIEVQWARTASRCRDGRIGGDRGYRGYRGYRFD